jgi:hypothetical protein
VAFEINSLKFFAFLQVKSYERAFVIEGDDFLRSAKAKLVFSEKFIRKINFVTVFDIFDSNWDDIASVWENLVG